MTVPSPLPNSVQTPLQTVQVGGRFLGDPSQAERRAPPTGPLMLLPVHLRLPRWTGSSGKKGRAWCSLSCHHSSPHSHVPGMGQALGVEGQEKKKPPAKWSGAPLPPCSQLPASSQAGGAAATTRAQRCAVGQLYLGRDPGRPGSL